MSAAIPCSRTLWLENYTSTCVMFARVIDSNLITQLFSVPPPTPTPLEGRREKGRGEEGRGRGVRGREGERERTGWVDKWERK